MSDNFYTSALDNESVIWEPESAANATAFFSIHEDQTHFYSTIEDSFAVDFNNETINKPEDNLQVEPPELEANEQVDNQMVVFTVEGSNELYGIQVAQDEEGNLQKYQFELRQNEEGQLEAVPETVQLLPNDDFPEEQTFMDEMDETAEPETLLEEQPEQNLIYEEVLDVKPQFMDQEEAEEIIYQPEEDEEEYEEILVKHEEQSLAGLIDQDEEEDNEDYEIVEGVHITGDIDPDPILQEIPKQVEIEETDKVKPFLKTKLGQLLLSSETQEKENNFIGNQNLPTKFKTNPRSILKSSHMLQQKDEDEFGLNKFGKRFAKSREAVEARCFQNFISMTTIPQAPIRSVRQPRKQQIKPSQRQDEQLIFQEITFTSNGTIVDEQVPKNHNLKITGYFELSDSENEDSPEVIEIASDDDSVHSQESKGAGFKCKDCDKVFVSRNSLVTHERHHKLTQWELKYRCETCGVSFKNGVLLKKHQCSTKSELKCTVCNKTFIDKKALEVHKKSHRKSTMVSETAFVKMSPNKFKPSVSAKKETCLICGKVFESVRLLREHFSTHSSFSCKSCKASFSSKVLLERHVLKCVKAPVVKVRKSLGARSSLAPGGISKFKVPVGNAKRVGHLTPKGKGIEAKAESSRKIRRQNCGVPLNNKIKKALLKFEKDKS